VNGGSQGRQLPAVFIIPCKQDDTAGQRMPNAADIFRIQRGSHDIAHEDPSRRYMASVAAGVFYVVAGIFGATVVALFAAFPKALIMAIAGLALFGTIANGLTVAMADDKQREAALITFLVTASGVSLFGIGTAFWGLVAGGLTMLVFNWRVRPVPVAPAAVIVNHAPADRTASAASNSSSHSTTHGASK
jgi:benzoate membrane transport protein